MNLIEKLQKEIDLDPMSLLGKEIDEKDLNFSEFEEFKNDEPVDSKGMTGVPDEDFTGVSNEDR